MVSLTGRQRTRILAGELGPVLLHEEPARGATLAVDDWVSITVTEVEWDREKEAWLVGYSVTDYRPRLLRRSALAGYTDRPEYAVWDEPEAVDREWEDQQAARAASVQKLRETYAASEWVTRRGLAEGLAEVIAECRAKGIDTSSVEHVTQRQIGRLRARLDRVAA